MRRFLVCTLLLPVMAAVSPSGEAPPPAQDPYAEHVARSGPRTPEEERKGFHLPPGFDVELVAAEPFVRKPININFDDKGRLWVSESVEYPFPAKPGVPHRDSVRILEDTNGDGRADEVTVFTEGLNIPIGVLPVTHGAIVYSMPNVWKYESGQDPNRAASHAPLLTGYGHVDTHGMTGEFTWGFDGWVYACHGYANNSEVTARDGSQIKMHSGNTYRFKPDGSHVEQFTWGQVNPFGLGFDPLGNLYSCDCHTRPIYQLLRGAWYPSFGAPHDGLGYGPEMMTHDHGSTAIAGISYYAADHFPPEYRDTVFVGNVVTNRINHDKLERHGSTYRAIQQPDFLVSDDTWFRPVDIKIGPDGAMYVADFYNRIIGHYEVPLTHPGRDRERGRIWRIIYRGSDGKGYPAKHHQDLTRASVPDLVQALAHPNLVVRMKATNQLVERGGHGGTDAVRHALAAPANPYQKAHGLWVLERTKALEDRFLQEASRDRSPVVRVHALKVLVERPTLPESLRQLALEGLHDPDAFVRRSAAEALGTHPSPANVRPLLDLLATIPEDDTHLLHMARMALRNQLRPAATWALLRPILQKDGDARAIADVAPGVHSAESARFLLHYVQVLPETQENEVRYVNHVARFGKPAWAGQLLEFARDNPKAELPQQLALCRAMHDGFQAAGTPLSADFRTWGENLTRRLLSTHDGTLVQAGIELGALFQSPELREVFARFVTDRHAVEAQRLAAMAALMGMEAEQHIGRLGRLAADAGESFAVREKAVQVLAGLNKPAARDELLKVLSAAPERLAVPVAGGLALTREGAEKLLDAVAAGKASAWLLQQRQVDFRVARLNSPELTKRLKEMTKDLPTADQRISELLARRREGFAAAKTDVALGVKVFEKSCAICHKIANKGAKIGPELDGIGIRGLDRILEDVIDPSRNVDQAFRLTTLGLRNGQIVSGLLLREEGKVYVLADQQGKEVRVPKAQVDDRSVSQLSPMPANLVDQIPEADFYHLMAFLLSQKPTKASR